MENLCVSDLISWVGDGASLDEGTTSQEDLPERIALPDTYVSADHGPSTIGLLLLVFFFFFF